VQTGKTRARDIRGKRCGRRAPDARDARGRGRFRISCGRAAVRRRMAFDTWCCLRQRHV